MKANIKDYKIIKGPPELVESFVKHMLGENWFVKGDLIPYVSTEGKAIVLQNMVRYIR